MDKKQKFGDKEALRVVIRYRVGSRVQKDVAELGGLDATTMSQFASGKRYPRPANMAKLAKSLGCSVSMVKAAVAVVLSVAEAGGDEAAQLRAVDRYFMGAEDDTAAAQIDQIQDRKLQDLVKNHRRTYNELIGHLATAPGQAE